MVYGRIRYSKDTSRIHRGYTEVALKLHSSFTNPSDHPFEKFFVE